MTREQAQLVRLLLICIAWSVGQVLTIGLSLGPANILVPAALAVGLYALTDDLGRPAVTGEAKYWRGQRVDDDKPRRGRWN